METYIKSLFVNHVVLFIGYSLQDIDLKLIMKWVKDILGEHFQRAYFLDSNEKPKGQVEINYFKNMGINIIDKTIIDEEYQTMKVDELKSEKGKNIVRCINYILDYENKPTDVIDYFFSRLSIFKDLNRLRFKDVFEALNIDINYTIREDNWILVYSNDGSKSLETLLKELIALDSYEKGNEGCNSENTNKANFIKTIFLNADIKGIIINMQKDNYDDISYEFQPKYKSAELNILHTLKINDYLHIKLYCEQTYKPIGEHKNSYFNELIQAYANYIMHRYVSSYEILKKLAKKAYREKEYIVFYICEFNKKQLIRFISNPFGRLGETVYKEHLKKIKDEALEERKNVDLSHLYYMLPKKEQISIRFLNDVVLKENYFSEKKVRQTELKKKVEEDITTIFVGVPTISKNITEMKREVHEFWEYTHNYFLMIDEYSDIRSYYLNYITVLLSTYSKKKETIIYETNIDFPKEFAHTLPDYKFENLDLYIMYSYVEYTKLISLFNEFDIEKIKTNAPNANIYFYCCLFNATQSYISLDYTNHLLNSLCNMIVISAKIDMTQDELKNIFEGFLNLINSEAIKIEIYEALNYFLSKIYEEKFTDFDVIEKFIVTFTSKLINVKYNNSQYGCEIEAISDTNIFKNLITIYSKNSKGNKSIFDELIDKVIYSINYGELKGYKQIIILEVLIPIFKILDKEKKKEIEKLIISELTKTFNSNLYVYSCTNDVIHPNKKSETQLYYEIEVLLEEKHSSNVIISPNPVAEKLSNISELLYKEKVINKDKFKVFKGYDNLFDLIIEPSDFKFDKFDLKWLMRFNDNYLKKVSNIDNAKIIISDKLKKELIEKNLDKRLKEIYFNYFN